MESIIFSAIFSASQNFKMSNITLTVTTTPEADHVYRNASQDVDDFLIGHAACGGPFHMVIGAVNSCMALTAAAIAEKTGFPYVDGAWTATATAGPVEGRVSRAVKSVHSVVTLKTSREVTQQELEEFYAKVEEMCFITNILIDAGVKFTKEISQTQGCVRQQKSTASAGSCAKSGNMPSCV